MARTGLLSSFTLACLVALPAATAQGQIPSEFTNLKLLGPEISQKELIGTMRDWATGLGVRCNHCHVGPDNLAGMDFASDEKPTKLAARRMLAMVRTINGELLSDLPTAEEGAGHDTVSCYTCHRGQEEPPRSLVAELQDVAAADGVEAALERYDALRREHYGDGVYDFSESTLSGVAGHIMEAGRPGDAVRALEKNLEFYPESADIHAMIGLVHLQTGDAAKARTELDRALAIDPENRIAGHAMQRLQASPPVE